MKKQISMILALVMLLCLSSVAFAADMGVQVIGGPDADNEPVSLDDIKLNVEATIDGYAIFLPTAYTTQDALGYYRQGQHRPYDAVKDWYRSGEDAEFVVLRVDMTNLATNDKKFLENAEVKVVFDEKYEYSGWSYQLNYDNEILDYSYYYGVYNEIQNKEFVIDPADNFAIGPMYAGHYFFGCTLPNAVLSSKKPLAMIITIDGNEITYNIRK